MTIGKRKLGKDTAQLNCSPAKLVRQELCRALARRSEMDAKGKHNGYMSGIVTGIGLMYLLDPDKCGRRRRVTAMDKVVRAEHVSGRFMDKAVRDMQNRAHGMVAET